MKVKYMRSEKSGPRQTLSGAGLALFGSEGRDIDWSRYFGVIPSFGDEGATVGVAQQQHGAVLRIDQAIGCGNIIGDGVKRILDRYSVQSFRLQKRDNFGPA